MNHYQSIVEEAASLLLASKVRSAAQELLSKSEGIAPVDSDEAPFRLFSPNGKQSNLELMLRTRLGMFFKPVGFYKPGGEVTILKEYESAVSIHLRNGIKDRPAKLMRLNDLMNTLIGAFSIDTLMLAVAGQETEYEANGIPLEIVVNSNGDPQIWSPQFDEAVAVYQLRDNMVNPTLPYKSDFDKLSEASLFSAFKSI